ncbi:TetR/AcrR family transcriptional regulator [Caulobacter soli]|uniref:TetR/AcrR family transcriptional regulator n=1 Tax=Caulobacter soli TaxID=2708539 RepID=UPI0013EB4272|nr:TetR/AcrR family transcriptional regulator [Caulobacter soli]
MHSPLEHLARSRQSAPPPEQDRRVDRLVLAAAQLLSDEGLAGASARAIAATAGVAPSAINYNFGNIEQLLSLAFARGADQTVAWLEARSREIQPLPRTVDGALRALEHVLVAWTVDGRPLALLYQEALAADANGPACAAWTRLWRDFWLDVAGTFGLSEIEGRLLHLFFECEALYHLSTWTPVLERAVLRELIDHFGETYLAAPRRVDGGALVQAVRSAEARSTRVIAPAAMRIAVAAAEVVEAGGFVSLTHRAVAARAGVTTGSVTHHFRTIEDLVTGAIRGQVQTLTGDAGGADGVTFDPTFTLAQMFAGVRVHVLGDRPASPLRRRLFLAAVRRSELAGAGAIIRFSHGGTTREALRQIYRLPEGELLLRSGLWSRLLSALWFACSSDETPTTSRERLLDELEARFPRGLEVSAA